MITHISPLGSMDLLAQAEVDMLKKSANSELYQLFRNCSLATLNAGSKTDSTKELLDRFKSFEINVISKERGVKLELIDAPESAFVDKRMIRSIQANLFAVLRDILFLNSQISAVKQLVSNVKLDRDHSFYITNLVFSILRNANALHVGEEPNLVVCWGAIQLTKVNITMPDK